MEKEGLCPKTMGTMEHPMMRGIMLHLKMMHREPKFSLDMKEKEKEILIFYFVRAWHWGHIGGCIGDVFKGTLAESMVLLPHILAKHTHHFKVKHLDFA